MPLKVWTAQIAYSGPDRLDITAKGKDPIGRFFAPSWKMVDKVKQGVVDDPKFISELTSGRMTQQQAAEQQYITHYHQRIEDIFKRRPDVFNLIMSREQIVLVCYCKHGDFCHRRLLVQYLQQLGAEIQGEITDFSPWIKKLNVIDSFSGPYAWLSNFAACKFSYHGQHYHSTEAFYQAHKCGKDDMIPIPHPDDPKRQLWVNAHSFIATHTAPKKWIYKAFKKGWVDKPDPAVWAKISRSIMRQALEIKFMDNAHYRGRLKATENIELVEGNTWHDNFWGKCTCLACEDLPKYNHLGIEIMDIRSLII